jgi:pyochelin biosynthetic protein PchG
VTSRPRVVVAGTGFGRVYLTALSRADSPFQPVGILARGSARSVACGKRYGLPLFDDVDALPSDVDLACVAVGSAPTGGPGARLATGLMRRGLHVLQEHPLHTAELADCLRTAQRHGVQYQVATNFLHTPAIRRFLAAGHRLLAQRRPLFVDAVTGFSVLYPFLDLLGALFGRLRPWRLASSDAEPVVPGMPYRGVHGVLAGVPLSLRVQHQLDPRQPDNHTHLWHRTTLGVEGGTLTLVSANGPVIWCPQPHMPETARDAGGFDELTEQHLSEPTATALTPLRIPTWQQMLAEDWPDAALRAVRGLWAAASAGTDPAIAGQYHLGLCRVMSEVTALLGPVELRRTEEFRPLAVSAEFGHEPESDRETM